MVQTKNLITLDVVTDDSTGNYMIGDVEWGLCGHLDKFLEHYGQEGWNKMMIAIVDAIVMAHRRFQKVTEEQRAAQAIENEKIATNHKIVTMAEEAARLIKEGKKEEGEKLWAESKRLAVETEPDPVKKAEYLKRLEQGDGQ